MAPTTRSRKSNGDTSSEHTSSDANDTHKQPKLEESAGFHVKDNDKSHGEQTSKSGTKREHEGEKQSPSKATKRNEQQASQQDVHAAEDKSKPKEESKSPNGSASVAHDGGAKIMPGSEKPPQELKPGHEEDAKQDDGSYEALEEGHIYFFYRPKVQGADEYEHMEKAVDSIDDVQNTHMLLIPQASQSSTAPAPPEAAEKMAKTIAQGQGQAQQPAGTTGDKAEKQGVGFRLVRLGKKRLPAPEEAIERGLQPGGIGGDSSEAVWSVIADIGTDVSQLAGEMGERRYSTRTRGERVVGPSRLAARGRYAFVLHKTSPPSAQQVRLCYALSHPSSEQEMGVVQKELGILLSSSVLVSMRNPTLPSTGEGAPPAGLPESQRVELDKSELQETFGGSTKDGGTRYARPEDVALLDREGVELLLTRERLGHDASSDKGAGTAQAKALENLAHADGKKMSIDDVFGELMQSSKDMPPDALQGAWI